MKSVKQVNQSIVVSNSQTLYFSFIFKCSQNSVDSTILFIVLHVRSQSIKRLKIYMREINARLIKMKKK